jgi:hypothetical protein
MNPEIKDKWLAALESGQYQQGKGVLRNASNEYCCLGVLCDLLAPNCWSSETREVSTAVNGVDLRVESYDFMGELYGREPYSLPRDLAFPTELDHGDIREVIEMNDAGESFSAIAKYIREHL